ncbi:Hypothetical Protein FCC1311_059832 [Hondaea fermentalgiana]|uniref:Thioesterase domain-containing protein n=1 Tax=Hondaea fermentalgiana TaxID=2315210 RepID=A0A2R5GFR9_9STRA|nr:Hypothetical Protein FCC1311_059832 [Hondaea fermentalgiana]|eukprot:GBG29762.1 Hypothetical Protein FCC1311_059832 [Hondaea fermentalgiana]
MAASFEALSARLEKWAQGSNGALRMVALGETPANSYCWHDARLRLGRRWAWDAREGRLWGVVQFTEATQGGPKTTHGGAVELVMDVASQLVRQRLGIQAHHASMTVRYMNLTPIDTPLLIEAFESNARVVHPVMELSELESDGDVAKARRQTCAATTYTLRHLTKDESEKKKSPPAPPPPAKDLQWPGGPELEAAIKYASEDGNFEPDEILPRIGEYPKFEFPPDAFGGPKILSRCFKKVESGLSAISRSVLLFGENCGPDALESTEVLNKSSVYVALDQLSGRATRLCINDGRPVTAELTVDFTEADAPKLPALLIAEARAQKSRSPSGKVIIHTTFSLLRWPDKVQVASGHGRFMQIGWDNAPRL